MKQEKIVVALSLVLLFVSTMAMAKSPKKVTTTPVESAPTADSTPQTDLVASLKKQIAQQNLDLAQKDVDIANLKVEIADLQKQVVVAQANQIENLVQLQKAEEDALQGQTRAQQSLMNAQKAKQQLEAPPSQSGVK